MRTILILGVFFVSLNILGQIHESDDYTRLQNACSNPEGTYIRPEAETVSDEERQALIKFYCDTFTSIDESKEEDGWDHYENWLSDKPVSEWEGIEIQEYIPFYQGKIIGEEEEKSCLDDVKWYIAGDAKATVVKVDLPDNNIRYNITNTIYDFALNPLINLSYLNLANNDLTSYKLSNSRFSAGNISNIEYTVKCSDNRKRSRWWKKKKRTAPVTKTGKEQSLENPIFAKYVSFKETKIKGRIHKGFVMNPSELEHLSLDNCELNNTENAFEGLESSMKLKVLNLSKNQFKYPIDVVSIIDNNQGLTSLNISDNEFEGSLNSLTSANSQLKTYKISNNKFEGNLSINFSYFPSLTLFNVSNNMFGGEFQFNIEDAVELNSPNSKLRINLSNNFLEGNTPSLLNSEKIDLGRNQFIFNSFEGVLDKNTIIESYKKQKPIDRKAKKFVVGEHTSFSLTALYDEDVVLNTTTGELGFSWYEYDENSKAFDINLSSNATAKNNVLELNDLEYDDEDSKKNIRKFKCKIYSVDYGFDIDTADIEIEIIGGTVNLDDVVVEELPKSVDIYSESFVLNPSKEYVLSAWVKKENKDFSSQAYDYKNVYVRLRFYEGNEFIEEMNFLPKGVKIKDWKRIFNQFEVPVKSTRVELSLMNESGQISFFDDVRIWPKDGSLKSFVYNSENHRLMAELDENNYATFYEYDKEGTLIRVKKETERGVFTIKETRNRSYIKNE